MSTHPTLIRRRLQLVLRQPDHEIDLAYAALLIAAEEYPDLDPANYIRRLAAIAHRLRRSTRIDEPAGEIAQRINHELFVVEGLRGNEGEYYDPRNSFLNEVFDRKLGIPITLSVIYLDLCWRLGVSASGVGLPGHFIVMLPGPEPIFVDPFNRGQLLTESDCAARVRQLSGGRITYHSSMLASLPRRHILTRMLTNLKSVYVRDGDYGRAYAAIDRLILINPEHDAEYRDRGAISHELRFAGQALADFHYYLDRQPTAPDRSAVQKLLSELKGQPRWRN